MEPLDVHSAPLHAQLLLRVRMVSTEVPTEKKIVPRLKLLEHESPVLTPPVRTRTLASSFFNAQWLHPCVCIAPHLVSGFSRRKSKTRSPCTEHLNMYTFTIFTHIQRAIVNQPECSRGYMFGFGLQSSFVSDACSRSWRGRKKQKKMIFLSRRWQKHMTRLQLEEHIFRRSHFEEEGRGACHRSGSCQLLSATVHSDVLVCFQQSNRMLC